MKFALALAAAALTASLTACGNATVPPGLAASEEQSAAASGATASTSPTAETRADGATDAPGKDSSDGSGSSCTAGTITLKYCPPGFRFPDGMQIQVSSESPEATTVLSLSETIAGTSSSQTMQQFRTMLQEAGYTINADIAGATLAWSGRGWHGSIVLGGVISWSRGEAGSAAPKIAKVSGTQRVTSSANASAAPTEETEAPMLSKRDLSLENAPFFMKYPAGTRAVNVTETEKKTTYTLKGHDTQVFAKWYVVFITGSVHFDVSHRSTHNGVTVLRFSDSDYDSELRCEKTCTMTHVAK